MTAQTPLVEERRAGAFGALGLDLAAAARETADSGRDRGQGHQARKRAGAAHGRAYYPPLVRWPIPTLAALAALSGCGGDDTPARTVTVPGDRAIRIEGDEYRFDPARVIVTGSPQRLRITLDNVGSLAHNVRVLDGERDLGGVSSFPSGEQRSATVGVPPGSYRLVCTVADHAELGMKGKLEVR